MLHIVVGYVLLGSARDGIVVLINTHPVQHFFLGFNDLFDLFLGDIFLDNSLREQEVGGVKVGLSVTNLFLSSLSGREVSRPVVLRIVRIGEHVVVFDWPCQILLVQGVDVGTWGRVHQSDVSSVMLVEIRNQLVHLIKVQSGVGKGKIAAKWNKHLIAKIVSRHFVDVFLEHHSFVVGIESVQFSIGHKRIVITEALVIGESFWPAIVIAHHAGKDLFLVTKML